MGWDFTHNATRKDVINQILDTRGIDDAVWNCLHHTTRGNVLWTVWEITREDSVERFIGCDLLRKSSYGWGHKSMCESMHPYYYTCPLAYLDLVPVACEEWREKVRQYHAKQKRKFQVGQVVELEDSTIPYVTITSTRPLLGKYNGKTYRIPKRMIATESAGFKKLKALQQEAEKSCHFRGHDMESWLRVGLDKAYSHCRICDMQVAVNVNPLPNGIDIGGKAVALHCTG